MPDLDESLDGSETDHQPTHEDIARCVNGMDKGDAAVGAHEYYGETDFPHLFDTGDGQTVIKTADLGAGTAGTTTLVGNRRHVHVPLQYRDFEITGALQQVNSVKRFLWEEDVTLVALRLRLDSPPDGDTILDLLSASVSLLDASKITFGSGIQVVRVVPTTVDIAAGDELQLIVTSTVAATPGSDLSGTIAYRPVLNQAA